MRKEKILIVDDDRDHLLMLAVLLRTSGYEVVSATSAAGAAQLAVEQDPDFLLLDIHLGDEGGYSIQERLQKIPEMASKPVIYITGDKSNWHECIAAGLGARGVLRKPFDRGELLRLLRAPREPSLVC